MKPIRTHLILFVALLALAGCSGSMTIEDGAYAGGMEVTSFTISSIVTGQGMGMSGFGLWKSGVCGAHVL